MLSFFLQLLDEKVKKERVVFSKFVEQEWNINQEKFNSLNSRLNAFVNTIWKVRFFNYYHLFVYW